MAAREKSRTEGRASREGARSLGSKWHGKCVAEHRAPTRKKATRKKATRKSPEEVVKFVEEEEEEGEREGGEEEERGRKPARKGRRYSTEVRFLEHKYIQCNINKGSDDVEVGLPEDIKPLLINVTFLLHELKQGAETKAQEELGGFISKIVTLITELSRRPIKKADDDGAERARPFDEIAARLGVVLKGHNGPDEDEEYGSLVSDIKHLESELVDKSSEVNYVRDQIVEERARLMSADDDLDNCLRNSILKNRSLKAEIKFNKAQFKRYAKVMAHKEQQKQKSDAELTSLRRKVAKQEQSAESKGARARSVHADSSDVLHGGSVTKYITSKLPADNARKRGAVKAKPSTAKQRTPT